MRLSATESRNLEREVEGEEPSGESPQTFDNLERLVTSYSAPSGESPQTFDNQTKLVTSYNWVN
jgi:hypothetical protein